MRNDIFKLRDAIEANFAWSNKKQMITAWHFERFSTTGLEFLVGKAIEYRIANELFLVFNLAPERVEELNKSYLQTVKTKRYIVKSGLIDNYIRLN
jgi:RNA-splicing ligase RtcB